jgi:hypothetical protein
VVLVLVGLAFAVPVLWTVSVGAMREVRRARRRSPRVGCQAWVTVPGLPGRLYRCCEPVYASGSFCRRHEADRGSDAPQGDSRPTTIDEPQAVGRALAQARIGIPLAILAVLGSVALLVWAIQRTL